MTKKVALLLCLVALSSLHCKSANPSSDSLPAHQYQGSPPSLTSTVSHDTKAWEVHTYVPLGWTPIDPATVDAPKEIKYAFINRSEKALIFFTLFPYYTEEKFKVGLEQMHHVFADHDTVVSPITAGPQGTYFFTFTGTTAMQKSGKALIRHPVRNTHLFLFITGFWPVTHHEAMIIDFDMLEESVALEQK